MTVFSCVCWGSLPSERLICRDWVILSLHAASTSGPKGTCQWLSSPRYPVNHPLLIQLMTVCGQTPSRFATWEAGSVPSWRDAAEGMLW